MHSFEMPLLRREIIDKLSRNNLIDIVDWNHASERKSANFPIITLSQNKNIDQVFNIIAFVTSHLSKYNMKAYFRGQRSFHDGDQFPSISREFVKVKKMLKKMGIFINSEIDIFLKNHKFFKIYEKYISNLASNLDGEDADVDMTREGYHYPTKIEIPFDFTASFLVFEGLLQHYGYRTRYLDVVTNLPIALWFSLYKKDKQKLMIENMDKEMEENNEIKGYSYLFVFATRQGRYLQPGIRDTETVRSINLNEALPYFALRPHIQHATVIIDKEFLDGKHNLRDLHSELLNYNKFVLLCLKIPRNKLYQFIGKPGDLNYFHENILFPKSDQMLSLLEDAFNTKRINDQLRQQVSELESIINRFLDKTRNQILDSEYSLPTEDQERYKEELSEIDELQGGNIFGKFIGTVD